MGDSAVRSVARCTAPRGDDFRLVRRSWWKNKTGDVNTKLNIKFDALLSFTNPVFRVLIVKEDCLNLIYARCGFTFKRSYNLLLWIRRGFDLKALYWINYFEISIEVNSNWLMVFHRSLFPNSSCSFILLSEYRGIYFSESGNYLESYKLFNQHKNISNRRSWIQISLFTKIAHKDPANIFKPFDARCHVSTFKNSWKSQQRSLLSEGLKIKKSHK